MNVSCFVVIHRSQLVPSDGRVEWLERHGVPPESERVELIADARTWRAVGIGLDADGSLMSYGAARADGSMVWPSYGEGAWVGHRVIDYLVGLGREAGRVPSVAPIDEALRDWLSDRSAQEAERQDRQRLADAERERASAEAASERERERERIEQERRALVVQWGSTEQLERFDAGVLPRVELRAMLAANLFPALPRYVEITDEDVRAECDEGEECEVEHFESRRRGLGEMSASEWQALRALRGALEGCNHRLVIVANSARCAESGHEVERLCAEVTLLVAGLEIDRSFAL